MEAWGDGVELPESFAVHLELPDTVTQRTVDLAHSLTDEQPNMYAKAQAIEAYLRTFEYDLSVSAPPSDIVDVADYFLFDLQRGYCDYYATAFVVLARVAGLPTRFATGFAPGSWNPQDGRWTITEAEAHSWPEVYFPTYGWIPFEPTAGRSELSRIGLPAFSATGGRAGATGAGTRGGGDDRLELADAVVVAADRSGCVGGVETCAAVAAQQGGPVANARALGRAGGPAYGCGRDHPRIWRWPGRVCGAYADGAAGPGAGGGDGDAGPQRRGQLRPLCACR